MDKKITETTTLEKIIGLPGAEVILAKYRVPCLTCPMAQFELSSLKIGDVCKMYGLNEKKLLEELNGLGK
ncbi:MAG: hypothetical protein PHN39_00100 [Candidatus Pacebacteria bacterium]|nr:hypothetical protein [Candidatus Paceibacterota bacterium]